MPPKKGKMGGKKGKKTKKVEDDKQERELVFKNVEDFQEYGQVQKLLGNCRCEVLCFDGLTRLGHMRGNLRKKKIFIKMGDIVLLSIREFEVTKCDILYQYNIKESRKLKNLGEIPSSVKINEAVDIVADQTEENDIGIDFEEEDYDDEEKENFKKDFEDNFKAI